MTEAQKLSYLLETIGSHVEEHGPAGLAVVLPDDAWSQMLGSPLVNATPGRLEYAGVEITTPKRIAAEHGERACSLHKHLISGCPSCRPATWNQRQPDATREV